MIYGKEMELVVERRRCPHCNQNLSLKTYKAHKRRYYDRVNDIWLTKTAKEQPDNFESSDTESPPSICENDYESMDDGDTYLSPPPSPQRQSKYSVLISMYCKSKKY